MRQHVGRELAGVWPQDTEDLRILLRASKPLRVLLTGGSLFWKSEWSCFMLGSPVTQNTYASLRLSGSDTAKDTFKPPLPLVLWEAQDAYRADP